MTIRVFASASALWLLALQPASAAVNFISNGGFEAGTYTSTVGGNTNPNVPTSWIANGAFDQEPNFNNVRNDPNNGAFSLSIGNLDSDPVATLSQSFADVAGKTYSGSLFVLATSGGDPAANFTVAINGVTYLSLSDNINDYTQETFSFVGTGRDTLTLAAKTDPGEWYVDDVSIGSVPEPSTWAMMMLGFGVLGFIGYRKKSCSDTMLGKALAT